jgi:hypothetical protein
MAREENAMKKDKKIPKDFGNALSRLINGLSENKYQQVLCNIVDQVVHENGLFDLLPKVSKSKDDPKNKKIDHLLDKISECALSFVDVGLMVGYLTSQRYQISHPMVIKDLNYLSSVMSFLKGKEVEGVPSKSDMLCQKLIDAKEGKGTITQQEIEEAAELIVLSWPRTEEAIKNLADQFKKQIPVNTLVV